MIPSRRLVVLYVTTAYASLALALALTAWNPYAVAGFFYHARMVAIVHLVTIGWIATSVLGMLYVVAPMALGIPFPARTGDYAAYALVVIGLVGMVAHFWLAEFSGMAWSAATAAAGIAHVVARLARNLRRARVPGGVKLHLYFASANIFGAMTAGVLLGFDKVHPFLPGYVLSNVFAHAHLAAIGWVGMMVVGLGYRLLPMIIPAASPTGRTIYISAVLLEIGVLGLFGSLLVRSNLTLLFAVVIVAGFGSFGGHIVWMLERQKRRLHGRSGQECASAHVGTAGAWFLAACVSGVMLTALPTSDSTLRAAFLYGVLGLVGCLAQVIVGLEQRILPMAAAYWVPQRHAGSGTPAWLPLQRRAAYWGWLAGIPALGAGCYFNAPAVLAAGAWMLFGAVLLGALDAALMIGPSRVS